MATGRETTMGLVAKMKNLARLTELFMVAYELIRKEDCEERSVQELFHALELFKEGKLEGTLLPQAPDLLTEPARRRLEFQARLETELEPVVWGEFLQKLPARARNVLARCEIFSFERLVRERELLFARGMGEGTYRKVQEALGAYGLYLMMGNKEIEAIFGPKTSSYA